MTNSTAVTTRQHFDNLETAPLFSVNPGVPSDEALERAGDLMLYVESLAAADAFINKKLEAAIIQTLSEMAKALINATKPQASQQQP
jgi:hypothetical protein